MNGNVPGTQVQVTGTASDGSAVNASSTSASDGSWSVLVPAGTSYTVTPSGDGWSPANATNVTAGTSGVQFVRCAGADAGGTAADEASVGVSRSGPVARAAGASVCPQITITPGAGLSIGGTFNVTGTGWSNSGAISLYVVNPNNPVGPYPLFATVGAPAGSTFTSTYTLKQWSKRATYPDFKDGCELELVAKQGSKKATAYGFGSAAGGIVYYAGTSADGYKAGDVYCGGEDPLKESNGSLMVLAPNDGSSASSSAVRLLVDDPSQSITVHNGTSGGVYLKNGHSLCIGIVDATRTSGNAVVISASNNAATAARGTVGNCSSSSALDPSIASNGGVDASCASLIADYALNVYQRGTLGGKGVALPLPTLNGHGHLSCTAHYVSIYNLVYIDSIDVTAIAIDGNFRLDTSVSGYSVSASGALVLGGGASLTQVAAGGDVSLLLGPTPRISSQQKAALLQISNYLSGKVSRPTTYIGGLATFAGVLPIAGNSGVLIQVGGMSVLAVGVITAALGIEAQVKEDMLAQFIADPPDSDYRVVANAQAANLPTVAPGADVSPALANSLDTLAAICSRAIGTEQALSTTLDRAGGATAAGATSWERIQLQQAGKLASALASLQLAYLGDLGRAAHALRLAHLGTVTISRSAVVQFARRTCAHGLPTALARMLEHDGYTAATFAGLRTEIVNLPAKAISISSAFSTAGVATAIRQEVAILRQFASRMRSDPLPPAIS